MWNNQQTAEPDQGAPGLPAAGLVPHPFPRPNDEFIFSGSKGGALVLSGRDLAGQELWRQDLILEDEISFSGLVGDGQGGLFLLATVSVYDPEFYFYPILWHLDGGGQVLSQSSLAGPLSRLGAGLAARATGGCFILQSRLMEAGTIHYELALVTADDQGMAAETPIFTAKLMDFGSGLLGCPDGGAFFTYFAHDSGNAAHVYTTKAVRLSSTGQVLWEDSFGALTSSRLFACRSLPGGAFLLVGNSGHGPGQGGYQTRIVRLDANGQVMVDASHDTGATRTRLTAGALAWDGGFFAVGSFGDWHSGTSDPWVVRTDEEGVAW